MAGKASVAVNRRLVFSRRRFASILEQMLTPAYRP